ELARQRAALEAQQLADEAERRQLELELLEEEEYDHQPSAVDRQALARPAAAAPSEPAAQLREPLQPGDRSSRTRDWVEQSSQYGQLVSAQPYDDRHQQEARRPLQPVRQQTTPQLPRVTLDKFSGSALEWPRWIALFRALVHDRDDLTDVERLTYLQAHLTGPAKESVRGMLCDSSLYGEAMRELEEEFGDPARVIHATMKKLLDSRPVKDGDMSAVTELSRDLRTAVRVLQCLHYDADISAATNVTAVISKLPAALALKWGGTLCKRLVRPRSPTWTAGCAATWLLG
ncbi:uncharacterized protein LOC122376714, partial [Amphibalanus amphitrite]|uniref:uncharacterized protein LOC122376714 n=1 Tax=Amphibalanus amphitrite TaxID=1232801 RepID=UPI001C91BDE8